jgi:arabinofuranosyltransferase
MKKPGKFQQSRENDRQVTEEGLRQKASGKFKRASGRDLIRTLIVLFCSAFFLAVVTLNFWLGDDGFIYFRIARNLVNGWGPVYNLGERVQAFTSPLWLFVFSAFYFVSREIFLTNLLLTGLLSSCLLFLFFRIVEERFPPEQSRLVFALIVLILTSSVAFIDYCSSGLENPLGHLMIVLFFGRLLYMKGGLDKIPPDDLTRLLFLASLGYLVRQDYLLIFLPSVSYLIHMFTKQGLSRRVFWRAIILGLSPAFAWTVFSMIYYGFPFPNPAYAKMNLLHPGLTSMQQGGGDYFFYNFIWDPLTLGLIVVAIFSVLSVRKTSARRAAAVGILLYLGYVFYVGGDFMAGRFFSAVFVLAVLILVDRMGDHPWQTGLMIGIMTLIIFFPGLPVKTGNGLPKKIVRITPPGKGLVIRDQKAHFLKRSNMLFCDLMGFDTAWRNGQVGHKKKIKTNDGRNRIWMIDSAGWTGFDAAPDIYLMDFYGLTNPLLARIPGRGRSGKNLRRVPRGYLGTASDGRKSIEDPYLREYYGHLSTIIHGPVFSKKRLMEILLMNMGTYDFLMKKYLTGSGSI